MGEPTSQMPVRPLLDLLWLTFDCTGVSWNWTEADGSAGVIMDPPDAMLGDRDLLELWVTGEARNHHALLAWYRRTSDIAPMTLARVPNALLTRRERLVLERPMARLGLEHQLGIIYRKAGPAEYSFVIARSTRDFDADDLVVAGHVQRAVRSLDQQCRALARLLTSDGSVSTGADLGLSGRELAVLQLVADGETTRVISRRLGCTPRTVEKHLERCYRKLGVRDRLNAVRVAQLTGVLGLVGASHSPGPGPLGPGEYRGRAVPVLSARR